MAQNVSYLGTYEGYPNTNTTTTKATGFDWLNAILNGANNILGSLFPGGLNNSGQNTYPGQYPYPTQTNTSGSNNLLLYAVIGFGLLYFLTKDK